MTRRARMGPIQTLGRGVDRMAPGGRRSASESPIRPFHRPVGENGEPPDVPGMICVDLVADGDGHTFRPSGGGTFGAPTGDWYAITLTLTATVTGDPLRYDLYTGGTLDRVLTLDAADAGPFTGGATIGPYWAQENGAPAWDRLVLASGFTGTSWVSASGVEFCYTPTPPAALAATVREVEI